MVVSVGSVGSCLLSGSGDATCGREARCSEHYSESSSWLWRASGFNTHLMINTTISLNFSLLSVYARVWHAACPTSHICFWKNSFSQTTFQRNVGKTNIPTVTLDDNEKKY